MYMLRIEHPVREYDEWKKVFDSDPAGRERSGVVRYRVLGLVDDPEYVMIDLEFEREEQAAALLASLRRLWSRIEGGVIHDPQARIAEVVDVRELGEHAASHAA